MTELSWGILLAAYLFIGGLAGGAYMVASLLDILGKRRYQVVSKSGTYLSLVSILVGLVLLIMDLGRPMGALNAYVHFPTSIMSVGTWIITGFAVVSLLTSILWFFNGNKYIRKILGIVGFILGGSTAAYTGLLLSFARGRPFWLQPFLPWTFIISGTLTGLAMALLMIPIIAWFMPRFFEDFQSLVKDKQRDFSEILVTGQRYFAVLIIIELALILVELGVGHGGSLLALGNVTLLFYVYLIFGLLVPLGISYLSVRASWKSDGTLISSIISIVLILVGGFLLRYVILTAGQLI
jgi:polysulfide reductase chain C